jgi:hypothetical protein
LYPQEAPEDFLALKKEDCQQKFSIRSQVVNAAVPKV